MSVINASGGNISNTDVNLVFSVGEVSVHPLSSASNIVTVGFLQPGYQKALAVGLLNFKASLNPQGQAVLKWSTPGEIKNNYFDVQRCADGENFLKLLMLTVAGSSNSAGRQNYQAIDPAPFSNVTYYRLKQVNKDGTFAYSNVIALVTRGANNHFILSPNPFAASISIKPSGQNPFVVKIFDMSGRQVTESSSPGNQASVDLSTLAAGMYLLQLYSKDGNFIQSVKITKK